MLFQHFLSRQAAQQAAGKTNISPYNPAGKLYQLSKEYGAGYYWIYEEKDLYAIKIHDFLYYKDYFLDVHSMEWPESLNITYFESVSGEELVPYRRLQADFVKIFFGGEQSYRAVIHKNIPIRSIGIEIFPEYYIGYLRKAYGNEYENPHEALLEIDQTVQFPELIAVLRQIWHYQGEGMSARLFYDGKIAKSSFKQQYGCTITEYIRQRRLSHAEMLLVSTDFTMMQIAKTVGYSNAGRFANDFKQSTGLYPAEFRKMSQRK